MLTEVNKDTALNPDNALGEGQILKISIISPSGLQSLTPGGTWLDMGWLPDGTYVLPNVEIEKAALLAAGREDGASVEIANRVTSSKIGYEIPLLTADDRTRTVWRGTPAATATQGTLAGIRAFKINRGAVVLTRFIFIKKRADGSWTLIFHPRFELSNNGKERGDANNEILKFIGSVRSYAFTPPADFEELVISIDEFGAEFEGDTPEQLDALTTALDKVALPAQPLTSGQAVANLDGAAGSVTTYTISFSQPSNLAVTASGGTGNLDIRVKDASGAVVAQGNAADNAETINAQSLAAGTYTIDVIGTSAYADATLTATATPV